MMQNLRMTLGLVGLGLVLSQLSVLAEEPAPTSKSGTESAARKTDAPALPPIPWSVIAQMGFGNSGERFGLSKKQQEDLNAVVSGHFERLRGVQLVQSELQMSSFNTHRFMSAAAELTAEVEAESLSKAAKILTEEQQGRIRQANRQQIQQLSFATQQRKIVPSRHFASLDSLQTNNDLLSILQIPDVQQALSVSDEQWQKIEAASKDAEPATRALILQLAEQARPMFVAPGIDLQPLFTEFGEQTLQLLTKPQAEKYQQVLQARQKKLTKSITKGAPAPGAMPFFFHGMMKKYQSQASNEEINVTVELHNAFDEPDINGELNLTPAQVATIAKHLAEFKTKLTRQLVEQEKSRQASQKARQEQLREVIVAHNTEYQKRLAPLLTPAQSALLRMECWKSLGWHALLKPEIIEKLELSAEQSAAIKKALTTPGPMMPEKPQNETFEEFKKRSDDFHKAFVEHNRKIAEGAAKEMTPEQRREFEKLTGLKLPTAASESPKGD